MKRSIKSSIVIALSLVLLYYSVAWAVLRCAHEEYDATEEACIHTGDLVLNIGSIQTTAAPENFECGGREYETESMAASFSSSQSGLKNGIRFHAAGSLLLQTSLLSFDPAPKVIFHNSSGIPFLSGLPRYVSLSSLRV